MAPGVSSSTNVTLTLTVNDGTVSTAATVTVTVNPLPSAITSVTARSVGPERVQIIANLTYINSTTAINFRYRVTSPPGVWTTVAVNASANDTTAIHKITSGLAVGTEYDFEASLSSNFAASVNTTHTHLGTTLFIIDTHDEELYEFTDLSDLSLDDDQGTFASTIDALRSMEEHKGWMYTIDDDSHRLIRSRTPRTVASWKSVGLLPAATSESRSLLSANGNLYNITDGPSNISTIQQIVNPSNPLAGITGAKSLGVLVHGAVYFGGKLYLLLQNGTIRIVPDIDNPATDTDTSASVSVGRGMTMFNGRPLLNEEGSRKVFELINLTGLPSAVSTLELGSYTADLRYGASIASWSGLPAPIVSSVSIDSIAGTTATANITATAATAAGVDFRFRYRIGAGGWTDASVSSTTTTAAIFLTGLTANQLYEYQASLDAAFPEDDRTEGTFTTLAGVLESLWSAEVQARTLSTATAPGIPTNLVLTPADSQIAVAWSAPSSDGGSAITGYDLDYKLSSSSNWSNTTHSGTGRTFTITSLTNGADYDIRVAAINNPGTGSYATGTSAPVAAATAPGVPTNLVLTPADAQIAVAWGVPSSNGGSAITGYDLDYKLSSSSNWSNTTHSGTGRTFTITSLTNGSDYDIRVAAINNPGTGSYATGTSAPVAAATAPGVPTNLVLTPADAQIAVAWGVPSSNGGSAITGYDLDYKLSSSSNWSNTTHSGTGRTFTITSLTNGSDYDIRVAAINNPGTGSYATGTSAPVAAATAPGVPTNLVLTPADAQIAVAWGVPSSNGGSAITGYDLDYKLSSSSNWSNTTHSGTGRTFTITSLTNGSDYDIRVAAINNPGTGSYATGTSAPVAAATAPGVPTNLVLTPADSQIAVAWGVPASNGGSAITGYDLDYKLSASSNWSNTTHSGTGRTFTITSLTNGSDYDIRVAAINNPGTGSYATGTSAPVAPLILTDFSTANLGVEASALITVGAGGNWYGVSPRPVSGSLLDGDLNLSTSNEPVTRVDRESAYVLINDNGSLDLSAYFGASGDGADLRMWLQSATDGSDLAYSTGTSNAAASSIRFTFDAGPPSFSGVPPSFSANERIIVAFASPDPPSAPAAPTLTISGSGNIDVAWLTPTSSGYSSISDYDVRYKETLVTAWEDRSHSGTALSTSITGLTNGTSYDVQVRASNADATGPWSTTSADTPANLGGPGAPAPPTLTSAGQQISVSWLEPADNGGSAINDYDLEWRQGTEGNWTDLDHTGTATTATITGLTNGQEYQVRVRAYNSTTYGNWSGTSQATPSTTPAQVDRLAVSVNSESLVAMWSAPANNGAPISDYDVQYRQGNTGAFSPWDHVGTATSTTITGLTNGQEYEIQVRAENSNGDGPWSASATGTPADFPDAPATPSITSLDTQLRASWTAPADNGGPIRGYDVEYREGTQGDWEVHTHLGTGTTATITGLQNGQPYQVQVRGLNVRGTGSWSQAGLGTPYGDMGPPTNVTVTPLHMGLLVGWEPPTQTGGRIVTSYRVVSYLTGNLSQATGQLVPLAPDLRTTTITGLSNGTSYSVYMFATYEGGNGTDSSTQAVFPIQQLPGVPTGLTLTPGAAQIEVSWTAPLVTGQSAISGYSVQYRVGNTGDFTTQIHGGTGTSTTITSLTNETEYEVQVAAVNRQGTGEYVQGFSSPVTVPGVPTGLTLAPGDIQIGMSWTAPLVTGGSDVTGYSVQYREGGTGLFTTWPHTGLATSALITGLTYASYQVQVAAKNAQGTGAYATATAEARNHPPVASATATPSTVSGEGTVTLDGTATDQEDSGADLTYLWTASSGVFTDADSLDTTWTAPESTYSDQTITLSLAVTDTQGSSTTATVQVTVEATPALVSGIAVALAGMTSVTLNVAIADRGSRTVTVYFRHRVLTTPTPGGPWINAPTATVSIDSAAFTVTGLAGSTVYEAEASLDAAYSPSKKLEFTSGGAITIGDLTVSDVIADEATLTAGVDSLLGATTTVYMRYRVMGGRWSTVADAQATDTHATFRVTGLIEFDTYEAQSSLSNQFPDGATADVTFIPERPPHPASPSHGFSLREMVCSVGDFPGCPEVYIFILPLLALTTMFKVGGVARNPLILFGTGVVVMGGTSIALNPNVVMIGITVAGAMTAAGTFMFIVQRR